MALPQDGQNANALATVKEVPAGKKLIFIDPITNEGGIITLEDLTTQILNNLTSKNFSLDQGTMPLVSALNQLNSNGFFIKHVNESDADNITKPGLYRCSNLIGVAGINFGYMFVFSLYNDERYVLQVLHDANSSDLRRRICISSKWTDWIKM